MSIKSINPPTHQVTRFNRGCRGGGQFASDEREREYYSLLLPAKSTIVPANGSSGGGGGGRSATRPVLGEAVCDGPASRTNVTAMRLLHRAALGDR